MAADKNKKVKQAIALEYDPADSAPKVIAMGPELYEVVAEILMFVDSMDKIKAKVSAYQDSQTGKKQ